MRIATSKGYKKKMDYGTYRRLVYQTFFKGRLEEARLTKKERQTLEKLWGLKKNTLPLTQEELAAQMGVTASRVSQLNKRTLEKIFGVPEEEAASAPAQAEAVQEESKEQELPLPAPAENKPAGGKKTFFTLEAGDLITCGPRQVVRVLAASGEGNFRIYTLSFEGADLDSENLLRVAKQVTPFELMEKGKYSILL